MKYLICRKLFPCYWRSALNYYRTSLDLEKRVKYFLPMVKIIDRFLP
jgi:hypothetical protein